MHLVDRLSFGLFRAVCIGWHLMPPIVMSVAFLAADPAKAAPCRRSVDVIAELEAKGLTPEILYGAERDRAAALYRAAPPVSSEPITEALLVPLVSGELFLLVGEDGQYCGRIGFTSDQVTSVIDYIRGPRA